MFWYLAVGAFVIFIFVRFFRQIAEEEKNWKKL